MGENIWNMYIHFKEWQIGWKENLRDQKHDNEFKPQGKFFKGKLRLTYWYENKFMLLTIAVAMV